MSSCRATNAKLFQRQGDIWSQVSGHEAVGILAEHLDELEDAAVELAEAAVEGYLQGRLS